MGVPTTDLTDGTAGNMTEAELAAALGEELPQEAQEPEPAAEAPEPEEAPKFVYDHNGVHKEFESELDLLKYESGRKSNELGELRARLEAYDKLLEGAGAEPSKPQLSPEEQEKIILKRVMDGTGVNLDETDPSAYKTIFKMIENALGMYDSGIAEKRYSEIRGTVEKITTRAQQAEALNRAGVSMEQVNEVLEKHPGLKSMTDYGAQMAVIADLVKSGEGKKPAPETANPLRQALKQPSAASHVEGSAGSQDHMTEEQALAEKADKMSDRELLAWLGKETAQGPKPWEM